MKKKPQLTSAALNRIKRKLSKDKPVFNSDGEPIFVWKIDPGVHKKLSRLFKLYER